MLEVASNPSNRERRVDISLVGNGAPPMLDLSELNSMEAGQPRVDEVEAAWN